MTSPRTVAVIDDDDDVRTALSGLLRAAGLRPLAFASAEAFLDRTPREAIDGLVADVNLPGMNGVELLQRLAGADGHPVAVMITGQDDEATRLLLKSTSLIWLRKPFAGDLLLSALELARSARPD